jgi:beta-mannosidase
VARAEGYGPHEYGENWKDYLWMEDREFIYRCRFSRPELEEGERFWFLARGIDYHFEVLLNGDSIHLQEGMFRPVELDLTEGLVEENELRIRIFPVPKKHPEPVDRTQAAASVKPAVSYGWDWHPRLIPSGIWDDTFLEIRGPDFLRDVELRYELSEDLKEVRIQTFVRLNHREAKKLRWKLKDPSGSEVWSDTMDIVKGEFTLQHVLKDPLLWWSHDQGDPALYSYEADLTGAGGEVLDALSGTTGFRRVRLVMNEGGWDEPVGFPKTRSVFPIQLELNGRKIFCRGSNWVNPEIFPGRIGEERYEELLDLARDAHFNLLRVWGGGIVNKKSFHRLCDEKGLLVWQEFPLACMDYEDSPRYLAVLEKESASIIQRIRRHPSLAFWSGGNELFNSWSGMTDQRLAIRLLNSQCYRMDPGTPFIATSPLYGMGHGHYVFRDPDSGEEIYSIMNRASKTAYTEFGVPSPADEDVLKAIIPAEELWPPAPGGSWESHHAYNAWVGDTWLMQDTIEGYFGKSRNLEELVRNGQLLQAEGYKAVYEEARRQKPYCSMALNWCFNEAWPAAANNSLISYPVRPKPSYYAVRDACRPAMTSCRNLKFSWEKGEEFSTEVWILNDSPVEIRGHTIILTLEQGGRVVDLGTWDFPGTAAGKNLQGPGLKTSLDSMEAGLFYLKVRADGVKGYDSSYAFFLK